MNKKLVKIIESDNRFVRWSCSAKGRKDGYVYYREDVSNINGKMHYEDYLKVFHPDLD